MSRRIRTEIGLAKRRLKVSQERISELESLDNLRKDSADIVCEEIVESVDIAATLRTEQECIRNLYEQWVQLFNTDSNEKKIMDDYKERLGDYMATAESVTEQLTSLGHCYDTLSAVHKSKVTIPEEYPIFQLPTTLTVLNSSTSSTTTADGALGTQPTSTTSTSTTSTSTTSQSALGISGTAMGSTNATQGSSDVYVRSVPDVGTTLGTTLSNFDAALQLIGTTGVPSVDTLSSTGNGNANGHGTPSITIAPRLNTATLQTVMPPFPMAGYYNPLQVTLPPLTLKTFSGNHLEFASFMSLFNTIIGNQPIKDVAKFQYLVSALEGDALALIQCLPITDENYAHAVNILKDNYGDTYRTRHHLLRQLQELQLVATSKNTKEINDFWTKATVTFNQLKNIAPDCDNKITLHRLIQTDQLISTVYHQTTREENATTMAAQTRNSQSRNQPRDIQHSRHQPSRGQNQAAPTSPCVFCASQEHYHRHHDCPTYRTANERHNRARQLHLCFKCLRQHEDYRTCTRTPKCRKREGIKPVFANIMSLLSTINLNKDNKPDVPDIEPFRSSTLLCLQGNHEPLGVFLMPIAEHEAIQSSLEKFWILDSTGSAEMATTKDTTTCDYDYYDYDYMVRWPYNQFTDKLPDNRFLANFRFQSTMKRLSKNENLEKQYNDIILDQLNRDFIEFVDDENKVDGSVVHYLSHHSIIKTSSKSTKVRIVFDASAKINKSTQCLNDVLHTGASLLPQIPGVCLCIRCPEILISGDIEKAFLQLGLDLRDRDACRFLWNFPGEDSPRCLRFKRVPFGVKTSPYLLNAAIKHHLQQTDNELSRAILRNVYVDKTYDPLGLLVPVILLGKLFFRKLWLRTMDWDSPLTVEDMIEWKSIESKWAGGQVTIRRQYFETPILPTDVFELHIFTDASEGAYGAVAYHRRLCANINEAVIIASQSRVSPVKKNYSIPQKELMGIEKAAFLGQFLLQELELNVIKCYIWSDSLCLVDQLATKNANTTFSRNRIRKIKGLMPQGVFTHMPGKLNPAHLVSRGCSLVELRSNELWWNGPPFLNSQDPLPLRESSIQHAICNFAVSTLPTTTVENSLILPVSTLSTNS